eukprot:3561643-Alexandrium_andersonii.AAC.1
MACELTKGQYEEACSQLGKFPRDATWQMVKQRIETYTQAALASRAAKLYSTSMDYTQAKRKTKKDLTELILRDIHAEDW